MNVSFICNFEDGIKKNSSKLVAAFSLCLLGKDPHLDISILKSVNLAHHLLLHLLELLFFPPCGSLNVDLTALLVPGITKLPIVNNDVLALLSAPFFVVKFFFLLGLALHAVQNLVLTALGLHLLVSFHLVNNHLATTSLALLALLLTDNLFILRT